MADPTSQILVHPDHRQNPKRVAADKSVTLRRSASLSPPVSSGKVEQNESKSVAGLGHLSVVAAASDGAQDASGKNTTGGVGDAAAKEWFDDSNENPVGKSNVTFEDHDEPFYLPRNKSSEEETGNTGSKPTTSPENADGTAVDGLLSNGSYSDDYRSIIDDLTIENKELKQRLRKYDQMYSAHLHDNKLFEVLIHQLAPGKKRKLEAMLREFAAGVDNTEAPYAQLTAPNLSMQPNPTKLKRGGSSHSTNKPQDSGYASISASGGATSSQSNVIRDSANPERPSQSIEQRASNDQRVRSYVQDLPQSLLPKTALVMSDKKKKRTVVQKLEQLFVGRSDTSTRQSHAAQQEEVSQSAAKADKKDKESKGRRIFAEGHREAKIHSNRRKKDRKGMAPLLSGHSSAESSSSGSAVSGSSGTSQRPTRPLDLDTTQAQDPEETILYMKHLGFDSPSMQYSTSPSGTQGWIPLNLLMNMAQLHVYNVTPAFVRDSVTEYSSHFEISEDGNSVRWLGELEPSSVRFDPRALNEEAIESSPDHLKRYTDFAPAKTTKSTPHSRPAVEPSAKSGNRVLKPNGLTSFGGGWKTVQKIEESRYYSPMFYHGNESDSLNDISSSAILQDSGAKSRTISTDSNNLSAGKASRRSHNTPNEAGAMIFYTGGKFYTDLSGDPYCMPSIISYDKVSKYAMGDSNPPTPSPDETKGPLSLSSYLDHVEAIDESTSHLEGLVPLNSSGNNDTGEEDLIDIFAVSGVGGTMPYDNFLVDVAVRHSKGKPEVAGTSQIDLRPTPLPPPSYAYMQFTSSGSDDEQSDEDEDEDDDDKISAEIERSGDDTGYMPPTFLNVYSSGSRQFSNGNSGESSSIDMLDYARRADPDGITAREKEFDDAESVEKVPGPPPSGSIAATIGDLSNFLTSQEDGASVDDRALRMQQRTAKEKAGMNRRGEELSSPNKRQEL